MNGRGSPIRSQSLMLTALCCIAGSIVVACTAGFLAYAIAWRNLGPLPDSGAAAQLIATGFPNLDPSTAVREDFVYGYENPTSMDQTIEFLLFGGDDPTPGYVEFSYAVGSETPGYENHLSEVRDRLRAENWRVLSVRGIHGLELTATRDQFVLEFRADDSNSTIRIVRGAPAHSTPIILVGALFGALLGLHFRVRLRRCPGWPAPVAACGAAAAATGVLPSVICIVIDPIWRLVTGLPVIEPPWSIYYHFPQARLLLVLVPIGVISIAVAYFAIQRSPKPDTPVIPLSAPPTLRK